ncbi:MAG: T9SS type A sorting domain-containing protein [Cytophagaceae bacterium]|nr:T9SS type A sorting domain-containing protein [Cytophagaceae bacterium]
MKTSIVYLVLFAFSVKVYGQVNTPVGATIPFGSLIQSDPTPYPFGLIATNLPAGAYNPPGGQYGKSQDAYAAYVSWKACYVDFTCAGGTEARVKFDNANQTVSEGIAYGMLLAAYAADKTLFNGLWKYYKSHSNGNSVMNWCRDGCANTGGTCPAGGNNGATDAEFDAAMALLVAECQWPTPNIPYDYGAEAQILIQKIRQFEIQPAANPPQYQANNGDGWGFGSTCRNPSYQSPAYYKLFQSVAGEPANFWNPNCVNASYTLINNNNNNTTGLISNWSDQNGTPNGCNGPNEYGFDACRNPWRMATDYLWNGDANALAVNNLVANWLDQVPATNVRGPLPQNAANAGAGSFHNATFVSTYGLAVMGTNNAATYQAYLNNMYTETVAITETQNCNAGGGSGYFGNTLRVLALFMHTGNFWEPCPVVAPVNLMDFNLEDQSGKVRLSWATSTEENNDYFNIERSTDGINFETLGTVKGAGKSSSILWYTYTDFIPSEGINFYRLAQHDFDGKVNYSNVITYEKKFPFQCVIIPNPFEDELNVSLNSPDNIIEYIAIKDLSGRILFESTAHTGIVKFDLGKFLSKGMYLMEIYSREGKMVSKIYKN